jgi:hypothetical protein
VEVFDDAEKRVAGNPALLHRVRVARLPIMYVQIAKLAARSRRGREQNEEGLERLQQLFAAFDSTARQEAVTHVGESRSYQSWAEQVKSLLTPRGK